MSSSGSRKRRELPIEVLKYRDYRYLWAGSFIAVLGAQMHAVAIAYQVFQITGSVALLGVLGLVRALALISTSLFSGMVVDASDRRKVMLTTQTILVFLSLSLAITTWLDIVNVVMLYVVAGAAAIVSSFDQPARQAILPMLVPREKLTAAMSLNILSSNVGMMTGPALGGFMIYLVGVSGTYLIDSLTFLGTITALLVMKTKFGRPAVRVTGMTAIRDGLRFIKLTPVIYGIMLIDFSATLLGSTIGLAPVFAETVHNIGPRGLGLLYSAPAFGAVFGASIMSIVAQPRRPGPVIIAAVCSYGACLALFGLAPNLWVALLFLAGAGMSDAVSMTMRHTVRLLATPDELRGRVAATHSAFSAGGPRLGEFQAGITASFIGPQMAMVAGGTAVIIAAIGISKLIPGVRSYEFGSSEDPPGDTAVTPVTTGDS